MLGDIPTTLVLLRISRIAPTYLSMKSFGGPSVQMEELQRIFQSFFKDANGFRIGILVFIHQ